jgi:hypothetical protein
VHLLVVLLVWLLGLPDNKNGNEANFGCALPYALATLNCIKIVLENQNEDIKGKI